MPEASSRDPVARAMALLAVVASDIREWGVRELAAELDGAPSTVHRLLSTLTELGYLRERDGRYRVGSELQRLARQVGVGSDLSVVRTHLTELVNETDESAIFGVFDRGGARYALEEVVYSPHPLRYVQELHVWIPVHIAAVGLAILSALSADEIRDLLGDRELQFYASQSVVKVEDVVANAAAARASGFAVTRGQKLAGAVGVSAPVWGLDSGLVRVIGGISLTIPQQRFDESRVAEFGEAVRRCGAAISAELGA